MEKETTERSSGSVYVRAHPRFRKGKWESVCQYWRAFPANDPHKRKTRKDTYDEDAVESLEEA